MNQRQPPGKTVTEVAANHCHLVHKRLNLEQRRHRCQDKLDRRRCVKPSAEHEISFVAGSVSKYRVFIYWICVYTSTSFELIQWFRIDVVIVGNRWGPSRGWGRLWKRKWRDCEKEIGNVRVSFIFYFFTIVLIIRWSQARNLLYFHSMIFVI